MSENNVKKEKFVYLNHLYYAIMKEKLSLRKKNSEIPLLTMTYRKETPSLNKFKCIGCIRLNDIDAVKITTSKNLMDELNINEDKSRKLIRFVKPAYESELYETKAIKMPFELFSRMLEESKRHMEDNDIDKTQLYYLMYFLSSAYSIQLKDKKGNVIAYSVNAL